MLRPFRALEALLDRAGPLGLFSEEMDAHGAMLGNFPQAFTHLALIEAALNLDAMGEREALHQWADGAHERPRAPRAARSRARTGSTGPQRRLRAAHRGGR